MGKKKKPIIEFAVGKYRNNILREMTLKLDCNILIADSDGISRYSTLNAIMTALKNQKDNIRVIVVDILKMLDCDFEVIDDANTALDKLFTFENDGRETFIIIDNFELLQRADKRKFQMIVRNSSYTANANIHLIFATGQCEFDSISWGIKSYFGAKISYRLNTFVKQMTLMNISDKDYRDIDAEKELFFEKNNKVRILKRLSGD